MRKPQISMLAVSVSVASMLLASTTSFAAGNYKENYKGEAMAPCPIELMIKDGLYVGIQGGYDSYRVVDDVTATGPVGGTFSVDPRLSASGAVGGLFIGYGKYLDNMWGTWGAYLGLEVFGNWSAARSDYTALVDTAPAGIASFEKHLKVKNNYGIDFLPGFKLSNASLFYVRLGYNWARFDVDEDITTGLGTGGVATFSASDNVTKGGFHYGAGIESTFYDNWSVRAEYTHTGFGSFDTGFGSDVTPADNQFLLGLVYHIAM